MIITNPVIQEVLGILVFIDDQGYVQNKPTRIEPITFNGTAPFTYSLTSGSLPTGMTLDANTGFISGTPTAAGTSSGLHIQVTDAAAKQATTASFSILITSDSDADSLHLVDGGMPPTLTYVVGETLDYIVAASGGTPPYSFELFGSDGTTEYPVMADNATGEVALERDNGDGTFTDRVPFTLAGTYRLGVTVTDTGSGTDSQNFEIVVLPSGANGSNSLIDGSSLIPTFSESFDIPISIYNPATKVGRWKTNYPFGNDGDPNPDDSSSRNLPGEKQVYTDTTYLPSGNNPFSISSGSLLIEAKANLSTDQKTLDPYTTINGKANPDYGLPLPYTSGLITTEPSLMQTYGFFEAELKCPSVVGSWSMFWLWNEQGDEITICDYAPSQSTTIHFSQRRASTDFVSEHSVSGVNAQNFHKYGVEWTADEIVWYIDRVEMFRENNGGLTRPMFVLANLAVGGGHGNLPENSAGFPCHMEIKSINAYKLIS